MIFSAQIFSLLLVGSISIAAPIHIHSISNVADKTAVAEVLSQPRKLISIDLDTTQLKEIQWPKEVDQEEVMALLNTRSALIMIAQWTSGDGKKPIVLTYNYSQKKWDLVGSLNCLSFDKIELAKNNLQVSCEDNSSEKTKANPIVLKLPPLISGSGQWTLPITHENNNKNIGFELEGSIFEWTAVRVHSAKVKTKSLTASDLIRNF